jgi:hypothetical protein
MEKPKSRIGELTNQILQLKLEQPDNYHAIRKLQQQLDQPNQ